MARFELWIGEKPQAKQRARHRAIKTGDGRVITQSYTPEETVNAETAIRLIYRDAGGPHFGTGPIWLTVWFVTVRPKSISAIKRPYPTVKPDWDNCGKTVTDALNGVAYGDDSQVIDAWIRKRYGKAPGMLIVISDEPQERQAKIAQEGPENA